MIRLRAADGFELDAYRADPAGNPRGGVIVVQENAGVTDHIKGVAEGFAADGYVALAPALYDRAQRNAVFTYGPREVEARRGMRDRVPKEKTLLDVAAAVRYLSKFGKVGIVGYCWGGSVVWLAATRVQGLACAVCYYGSALTKMLEERPRCPVMLHWGRTDSTVEFLDVLEATRRFPEARTYYYDAGHAFNNELVPAYQPEAARVARARTLGFLAEYVG
jgi:carboxymethylenebutenolidase